MSVIKVGDLVMPSEQGMANGLGGKWPKRVTRIGWKLVWCVGLSDKGYGNGYNAALIERTPTLRDEARALGVSPSTVHRRRKMTARP